MKIEVVDKEGALITNFELEANPFKVGETIHVNVSNHNKRFWTKVEEIKKSFIIDKIEHFVRMDYIGGDFGTKSDVLTFFTVSVEVSPVD